MTMTHRAGLRALVGALFGHRRLVWQMARREVIGRYRGSVLGLGWSFFNPLVMLAVYTYVFSEVFNARWNIEHESKTDFALILFAGLIMFNLVAETLNRAPSLIISNTNYVKKVVFPLEVLPAVALLAGLFHAAISLVALLLVQSVLGRVPQLTALMLPVVMVPLLLQLLGWSWFLASLGVYLRDVGQAIGLVTLVLMFLSPVFFPLSALPDTAQQLLGFNPLAYTIEAARAVLLFGQMPSWTGWVAHLVAAMLFSWLGFVWFQKTRRGFADVL